MSLTVGGQTGRIETQLAQIENRLDQAVLDRRRIEDTANIRFDGIDARFDRLEEHMEERFDRLEELILKGKTIADL